MSRNWILPEILLEILPEMPPKFPPGLKSFTRATNLGKPCHPRAERVIWLISSRGASLQAVCRRSRSRPCKRRKPAPFSECSAGRRLLEDRPGMLFLISPSILAQLKKWADLCFYICLTLLDFWRCGLLSLYTIRPRGFCTCLIDTSSCEFL
jgi:hypothetical protein